MSKITQDFISNIGSLYEQIHIQDQDFLNEDSEYYDEEAAELAEDIILSLALSMFSEGYTADTFIKFLASSDEAVILEKYLATDVSFISEELIHNDFVEEQLAILEAGGFLGLLARGAKALAKGAGAAAKATKSAVKTGVTKAATAGVDSRIGKQFAKSANPSRTTAALEKVAKNKATKSGITVPQGSLSPKQSADLIKQARTVKAIKGVKTAGGASLAAGLGAGAVYALKPGGSGGVEGGPKPTPSSITPPPAPILPPPSGGSGGRPSGGSGGRPSGDVSKTPNSSVNKKYDQLRKSDPEAAKKYGLEQWAKLHPNLTKNVNPDGTQKGTGKSQIEKDAAEIRNRRIDMGVINSEIKGGSEGPGKIDSKSVDADVKAQQERDRKKAEKTAKDAAKTTTTTVESYDAYDLVLEYLINYGHADTLDEAHYLMLEMDAEMIGGICGI
jgi:hypothetical protein